MAEYFSLQSALLFSITHIFVRRGLLQSNALTGSLISLGTSTVIFWFLLVVFVPLSSLLNPNIGYFIAGGVFAPAIGQTLGYIGMERLGVARASSIVNTSPIFSSILAVFLLGERWVLQNIVGTFLVIVGVVILSSGKSGRSRMAEEGPRLSASGRAGLRDFDQLAQGRLDRNSGASARGRGDSRHGVRDLVVHHSMPGRNSGAALPSREQPLAVRRRGAQFRRDPVFFRRPQPRPDRAGRAGGRLQSATDHSLDQYFSPSD